MSEPVRCVTCQYLSFIDNEWVCTALGDDLHVSANDDIYEWHNDCPYWADEVEL